MPLEASMWVLPAAFILHDAEELLFFSAWIRNNRECIRKKYPTLANVIFSKLEHLSTASLATVMFEEFLLLSAAIYLCITHHLYSLFAALAIGYLVHVVIHVLQLIVWQKYIPGVGTGCLTAGFIVYALIFLDARHGFHWQEIGLISPAVVIMIYLNLVWSHYWAGILGKRLGWTGCGEYSEETKHPPSEKT